MKKVVAALIAGVVLGSASVAGAVTTGVMDLHSNGVWCKAAAGGVACVALDGPYGVGIHRDFVIVRNDNTGRIVFKRYQ